jgi:hypothetical protein
MGVAPACARFVRRGHVHVHRTPRSTDASTSSAPRRPRPRPDATRATRGRGFGTLHHRDSLSSRVMPRKTSARASGGHGASLAQSQDDIAHRRRAPRRWARRGRSRRCGFWVAYLLNDVSFSRDVFELYLTYTVSPRRCRDRTRARARPGMRHHAGCTRTDFGSAAPRALGSRASPRVGWWAMLHARTTYFEVREPIPPARVRRAPRQARARGSGPSPWSVASSRPA